MASPSATTTLPLYWHLSSADKAERLDASAKLLHTLHQFQENFVTEVGDETIKERLSSIEDEGDELENWSARLDASNAIDVAYAIRRLIRGLASPRDNSRLGFAVALTELLSIIDTVTCEQVLALLKNASQTSGSMSGQEERDMLFARLFGLKSIVQSGLLTRSKPLRTSSNSPSSLKSFEAFLDELLTLGEKKSWLKESCWWTLISAAFALHEAPVAWKKEAEDTLFAYIYAKDKTWSPEKIAVTLKLQRLYPEQAWQNFSGSFFKSSDILANSNLSIIGRILKDLSSEEFGENDTTKASGGPWKPQLHFVWDIILDEFLEPESSSRTSGKLQDFYRAVVDESLFSSSSSPQRKYWGFVVFQKTLKRIPPSNLQMLFTKNFMRTWINHLSKQDRYLHKISRQVATEVLEVVENDPKAGYTLVLQLTGTHGSHQFDKITKTKTVESILAKMDDDGIKEYLDYLLKQVNDEDTNSFASLEARRLWIVDQLAALLRKSSIPKSVECMQMALHWLTTHAFFVVSKKSSKSSNCALRVVPEPAFSDELHDACRSKLLSALADLIVQPAQHGKEAGDKDEKQTGGEVWMQTTLDTINALEKDTKHVQPIRELDEDAKGVKEQALATLQKIKSTEKNVDAARGIRILLSSLVLKYMCDDEEDAEWDILQDCTDAAANIFKPVTEGKKKCKDKEKAKEDQEESDRSPIDYIVDIIIGLLENSTAFTRSAANMAFSLMTSLVKESTVDLILAQLERRDPAEDGSHDEDSEGIDEDDDAEDEKEEEEGDQDEEDEENEDGSDEENEDEEATNALRKALEEAVGMKGVNADDGESSDDESDEESMDDEQMMQIDEKLAAVFRSRVEERKKGKNTGAQREATYFKNRVLDLVETFIKKQPSNPLIFRFILPLVEMLSSSSSDEKQLADKTTGILRSRFGKPKETVAIDDSAKAVSVLDSLHQRARKAHSPETVSAISVCSLFVVKSIIAKDESAVLRIYKESLSDFVTRKASSLSTGFILDFIKRFTTQAWNIRTSLVDLIPNSANGFRQAQVFSLIQSLLTALPNPDSRKEEIAEFMPSVSRALSRVVSECCVSDKPIMTTAQMKETLKDGLQFCRFTKRFAADPKALSSIWKPEEWDNLATQLEASSQFKASVSLAASCRQISKIVKTSDGKTTLKRKADAEGAGDAKAGNEKAKRRKAKKV